MAGAAIEVITLVCGPLGNNVYVVAATQHGEALVVDPAMGAIEAVRPVLQERNLRLSAVVATHSHWDHIAEAGVLAEQTGAPVIAHQMDAARIANPPRPMMFPEIEITPAPVARELVDGDVVALGDLAFQVIHTPGHTPGSMCLYLPEEALLLSGDTLFAGSFGRYDLPGGDRHRLEQSLLRLAGLPVDTRVLPGHGSETTIGSETWLRRPPL